MTNSRHRAPSTPSMDPTGTAIVLATCVFLLSGLAASTQSPTVASSGAAGLGAAMTMSSKMPGLHSL
ncbi:hypothetical protein [Nocardia salmonicida]|uniref:hypothetical protein n=1 Tax=Nocardia salmonicida TaxID=53431 RepID=UPI001471E6FB|nr:hypothetical protein [Nocardia salmonicida]